MNIKPPEQRVYCRSDCAVFRKTSELYGGLSNMAPGFPLKVNDVPILTSEALYQAFRFPHRPEVQRLIIEQYSPMTAKMKSKPHRWDSRPDWDHVRVAVMRWCLRVKLAQNWTKFGQLLAATGDRPIVEDSRKDDFWGAKAVDGFALKGANVLGRLLMELRATLQSPDAERLKWVAPPSISNALLFGVPIMPLGVAISDTLSPQSTFWPCDDMPTPPESLSEEQLPVSDETNMQGFLFEATREEQSKTYDVNVVYGEVPPKERNSDQSGSAAKASRKRKD